MRVWSADSIRFYFTLKRGDNHRPIAEPGSEIPRALRNDDFRTEDEGGA